MLASVGLGLTQRQGLASREQPIIGNTSSSLPVLLLFCCFVVRFPCVMLGWL